MAAPGTWFFPLLLNCRYLRQSSQMTRQIALIAFALAVLTLGSSALLVVWDIHPQLFPSHAHDYLAAFSLGVIAIAWIVWQAARKASGPDWLKALLLAAAFVFWGANQFWPDSPSATLYNDLAVGLFVLDVFLSMAGGAGGTLANSGRPRQSAENKETAASL